MKYDISLTQSSESESSEYCTDSESKPILRNNTKKVKPKRYKKRKKTSSKKSIKWSKMEEYKLIKIVESKTNFLNDKNRWIEIAKQFENRSSSSLKRKYESLTKNSIPPQRFSPRRKIPKHHRFSIQNTETNNNINNNNDDFDHQQFWNQYQDENDDEIEIIPNDKQETIVNMELNKDLKLNSKINIKCPLTQCIMKIAWKSAKCGHIFDKMTILNYIKQNQKYGTVICPIPGCSKKLRQNEWSNDQIVQNEIDKINRKRKRVEIENCDSDTVKSKKQRL